MVVKGQLKKKKNTLESVAILQKNKATGRRSFSRRASVEKKRKEKKRKERELLNNEKRRKKHRLG